MKIIEIWTSVKEVTFGFIGFAVVVKFETYPCAQHCCRWHKQNPAFIIDGRKAMWYC